MSEIRATTISDAAGTGPATLTGQYAAKAWVSLIGTGTITIRGSFNVSSVTDIGTGQYSGSLTNSMTDINQTVLGGVGSTGYPYQYRLNTVSVLFMSSVNSGGSFTDVAKVEGATLGDLA